MAIFETTTLDAGVINQPTASAQGWAGGPLPAAVVNTAANSSGTITGQKVTLSGAMEDIEYTISSPPFQINGSTQATGSFVTTITFYAQDGATVLGTAVSPTVQCSATVLGNVVGNVFTMRMALPMAQTGTVTQQGTPVLYGGATQNITVPQAAHSAQAVTVVTGAAGQLTAGWTLGGHRRTRAG